MNATSPKPKPHSNGPNIIIKVIFQKVFLAKDIAPVKQIKKAIVSMIYRIVITNAPILTFSRQTDYEEKVRR